jgi:bifunctional DNase/RNase
VKKVKLDILGLSSSQSQRGSYALILGEQEGNRRFPIIIAMPEAQAISVELQKIHSDRPFTHDLFKSFAESFHFDVIEVIVSDLKDGIFFGEIVCIDKRSGKQITIDARSSDAIAIGLRFNVMIYTYEFIMQEAAIALDDIEDEEDGEVSSEDTASSTEENKGNSTQEGEKSEGNSNEFKKLDLGKLEEILKKALQEEDYERAVLIRDEIESRQSN